MHGLNERHKRQHFVQLCRTAQAMCEFNVFGMLSTACTCECHLNHLHTILNVSMRAEDFEWTQQPNDSTIKYEKRFGMDRLHIIPHERRHKTYTHSEVGWYCYQRKSTKQIRQTQRNLVAHREGEAKRSFETFISRTNTCTAIVLLPQSRYGAGFRAKWTFRWSCCE